MENAHILIVENEKQINRLLKEALLFEGYTVSTAYDGEEALELLRNQQPDLLLLEVMLPGMSGYEVVRHLRMHPQALQIPIIVLSSLVEPKDAVFAFEVGVDDYITKPFHTDELLARIKARVRVHLAETRVQRTLLPNTMAQFADKERTRPIDFCSCFISYSSKDQSFAERLYADLESKGVRCWFATEDLKIGEKFCHRIDESIMLYDKLLVVLSQHSVESEWVEREVMAALEKEREQQKLVLFPITLDEVFKRTLAPWAADLRRQRHIGDFTRWKNHDDYQKAFTHLLRDLKTEDQKMGSQGGTTNGG